MKEKDEQKLEEIQDKGGINNASQAERPNKDRAAHMHSASHDHYLPCQSFLGEPDEACPQRKRPRSCALPERAWWCERQSGFGVLRVVLLCCAWCVCGGAVVVVRLSRRCAAVTVANWCSLNGDDAPPSRRPPRRHRFQKL